jgi:predicted dehydrogenase
MKPVCVGIVGCGNISDAYFAGAARSKLISLKACADIRPEAARDKALHFGVQALSVQDLLCDPDIEIVVNLTIPTAHATVGRAALEAGKHLYLEKPIASSFVDALDLIALANASGLRIGCAPDTFLGAAHQACRAAIDAGEIGEPIGGAVAVLSRGPESWHPNPEFLYRRGGGPMHDMGGYYITQLVNLLGPVRRVSGCTSIGLPKRLIATGPLAGKEIDAEVPTTANGTLEFACGANITMSASFDVWAHRRVPLEIYGTTGSLLGGNPNFFGGEPQISRQGNPWQSLSTTAWPFGRENFKTRLGQSVANYRTAGLIDMAAAIRRNRMHRASGELALHVLEVLDAFERSSGEGRHICIESVVARPDPVPCGADEEVFLR